MDAEALQAFLTKPLDAIISTNRVGKGSQLAPVWFVWDGEAFLISTQKASAKHANIVRDPNISVIVNEPATNTYVLAYGRAEVVELERYPEHWNAITAKYRPEEKREQYATAMQAIERMSRVIIALKPEKMVGRSLNVF
jgi:PPOX class probable F420-dependent enzyme